MTATDQRWMRLALGLAARGLGRVWPNPAVGCVLVKGGRVVGRGWTQPGGRPHAEAMALAAAGPAAKGATAYVTLEPCAHIGRAGPCADALIAAGIARLVSTAADPDPRTAGRGFARLRAAGVTVDTGCLADEAAALNAGFLSRLAVGRPFVTLKLATSLDGRIATGSGESRWITSPESRRQVHLLRARHDAVLVGAGTARADDPMLTVRDIGLEDRRPVRIVVAGGLSLSTTSRLGASAAAVPLWLCHDAEAAEERRAAWAATGARLIEVPFQQDGQLDLAAMMAALADRGLTRILCEGGGRLSGALLAAGLVDQLMIFAAGRAIGEEGIAAVGPMGIAALADAPRFALSAARPIGPDLMSVWDRIPPDS